MNQVIEELNKEQGIAVNDPINTFVKVVAGAGTGKTKIISKRYIKLIKDLIGDNVENPIEHLLVITFTEKAASEMKERIFKELKLSGINYFNQEYYISTIHSFCSKILRRYAFEIGLTPNFSVGDKDELEEIYKNIVEKIKFGEFDKISFIDQEAEKLSLNKEILDIKNIILLSKFSDIEFVFSSIYEVIKKIKSLGISPLEFLNRTSQAVINFSNAVKKLNVGYPEKELFVSQWRDCLKDFIDKSVIFDEKLFGEITEAVVDKNGARGKNSFLSWTLKKDYVKNIEETTEIELELTKVIALIYSLYQQSLIEKGLISFDDLINMTLEILQTNDTIRNLYQSKFRHIIIDEFQDTNGAQMKLLLELMNSDCPNVTVVGDKKQSIYSFRYARMENLDDLQKIIEKRYNMRFSEIKLSQNYRSGKDVLDIVNYVTNNFLNLDEVLYANKVFDVDKPVMMTPICADNTLEYSKNEAMYIADEIMKCMKEKNLKYSDFAILSTSHSSLDEVESELEKNNIPSQRQVNTLFFNKDIIKNIYAAFKLLQIPSNESAFVKLLQIKLNNKELYDFKNYVNDVCKNFMTSDELRKKTLAQKALDLYSQNKLNQSGACLYVKELFDTLDWILDNKNFINLIDIFNKIIQFLTSQIPENCDKFLNINIDTFRKIVEDFSKYKNYVGIKEFNDYLEKIKNDRDYVLPKVSFDEVDAVNLLTIHASKGLEFSYVFLLNIPKNSLKSESINFELDCTCSDFGLVINKYKDITSSKSIIYNKLFKNFKNYNEKIRLYYVALSRAKIYLNILFNMNRTADYVSSMYNDFPSIRNCEKIKA